MRLNAELDLQDMAAKLYDGEEARPTVCPFCGGGTNLDISFCMKREGYKVLYICHRASCGIKGVMSVGSKASKAARHKKRVFVTDTDPLCPEARAFLMEHNHLSLTELNRGEISQTSHYSPAGRYRIYMPIFRPDGTVRGYACKDLFKQQSPKVLNFLFKEDECKVSWYSVRKSKALVVVEDQLSAIRLSSYVTSVALLGTHISEEFLDECLRTCGLDRDIYLSLDKDATNSAIKQALNLASRVKIRVVPLEKDIKDLTREELEVFVKRSYNDPG